MPAGSSIIARAQIILQDKTGIRWPVSELAMWMNDGCREIVTLKPSALTKAKIHNLIAGSRQTLSANSNIRLVRPIRNMTSGNSVTAKGGRIVTAVPREVMDSQNPHWQNAAIVGTTTNVIHIVYDPDDPLAYYCYPPNTGNGHLELLCASIPLPIEPIGPREVAASWASALELPQIHLNALVDYVCFRAYSKDNDASGNVERASFHYQAMAASLGVTVDFEIKSNPNTTGRSTDLAT